LRRGPTLAPSILTIEDLTVDTRARRVERAGRVVPVTTKEYTLLEYMVRRQGEVVGRADIAEHVWDDSFDPMSNLIEVYIQRLRRKIDDGHPVKLIHTRRGAGYTLAAAADARED
jgi:two-component system copper resistance phosphate regulon response regulator CusR